MLLDKSYFIGPYALAQLGKQSVVDNLNDFIEVLEPEIMQAAMGYDLYKAFMDGLDVGSDEEVAQRWLDLRDGLVFPNQMTIKKVWKGFANATAKQSILTAVVYTQMLRDQATANTGTGVVKPQAENSVSMDPTLKMTTAWFNMRQQIFIFWELLRKFPDVYPEYSFQQINYGYFGSQNQFGI